MSIKINNTVVIDNDKSFRTASGSSLQRPAVPETAMIRYNTTFSRYEFYDGTTWQPVIRDPILSAKIVAWGVGGAANGDGTGLNRSSPVSVVGGFTDWVQIASGSGTSYGIRSNGTMYSWGSNTSGELGDGTTTVRSSPVSVVGAIGNWIRVSAGDSHVLAIRTNGTAWAWGSNGTNRGMLGDNTVSNRSSPVSVVGGFTNWIKVAAGGDHSLGLRANGTLYSWGLNTSGQLGDGTTSNRSSPVLVTGSITDWIDIQKTQSSHSLAIRANGTAYAWGNNSAGQLGVGNVTNRSSPTLVVGGFGNWVQLSGGTDHTLGLRSNGIAYAWGSGSGGRLGTNNTSNYSSPVSVVGGFTDWVQVSAAGFHSVGLRANGTAYTWGSNNLGRLGIGSTTPGSVLSPVLIVGGYTDWLKIAAGDSNVLGLRTW